MTNLLTLSLSENDLVVVQLFTNSDKTESVEKSARILRIREDAVSVQINGLDTKDPYWGMRLTLPARQVRQEGSTFHKEGLVSFWD